MTQLEVQFARFNSDEVNLVRKIAKRARAMGIYYNSTDCQMDLSAVCFHTPLRLNDLLAADDANFGHDLGGIRSKLDRNTGKLTDHFLPRFAAPVKLSDAKASITITVHDLPGDVPAETIGSLLGHLTEHAHFYVQIDTLGRSLKGKIHFERGEWQFEMSDEDGAN